MQCFGAVLETPLSVRAENQPWVVRAGSAVVCTMPQSVSKAWASNEIITMSRVCILGPGWTHVPPLPSPFYIGIGWASPRRIQVPVLIKVRIPERGGSEDFKSVL